MAPEIGLRLASLTVAVNVIALWIFKLVLLATIVTPDTGPFVKLTVVVPVNPAPVAVIVATVPAAIVAVDEMVMAKVPAEPVDPDVADRVPAVVPNAIPTPETTRVFAFASTIFAVTVVEPPTASIELRVGVKVRPAAGPHVVLIVI